MNSDVSVGVNACEKGDCVLVGIVVCVNSGVQVAGSLYKVGVLVGRTSWTGNVGFGKGLIGKVGSWNRRATNRIIHKVIIISKTVKKFQIKSLFPALGFVRFFWSDEPVYIVDIFS